MHLTLPIPLYLPYPVRTFFRTNLIVRCLLFQVEEIKPTIRVTLNWDRRPQPRFSRCGRRVPQKRGPS
ncbi:MAG: hypothetical protein QGF00_36810, partial [Planctomycetota bacterium]|nr:hypothetical protein [Planctomycetota bacterium]